MPHRRRVNDAADAGADWGVNAVVLFSAMINARHRNLFAAAAEADRQLQDLGVVVKFRRPPVAQGRVQRVGGRGR